MRIFAARLRIHGAALRHLKYCHQPIQVLMGYDCMIISWPWFGLSRDDVHLGGSGQKSPQGMKSVCGKDRDSPVVVDVNLKVSSIQIQA